MKHETYTRMIEGRTEQIKPERWAWAVIYKPTETQLAKAKAMNDKRVADLEIEKNREMKNLRETGATPDQIEALKNEYDEKMAIRHNPERNHLYQFDPESGVFHNFAEVRQGEIELFTMWKPEDETLKKRIDIAMPEGAQAFHFYRNFGFDYMGVHRKERVYCFGYKKDGRTAYHFILPDDRVVVSDEDIDLVKFNI